MANPQSCLERYHHYQTSFVQWLGVAARQCGFIFSRLSIRQQSGNRSRQKRGKPNQSVVKRLVTALELIEQATFLKDSGRREAVIPGGIRRCLRKTINLRESHSHLWSQSSTNPDDWARHEAFIQVLKTCYDLLTGFPSKSPSLENETNDDQVQKHLTSNCFESLRVDDLESDDEFDSGPHEVGTVADSGGVLEQFELEPTAEPKDDSFACYCFFHDLHDIENRLLRTWQRFSDRQVPLAVAGLVTKVGIDAVRNFSTKALKRRRDRVSDHYESLAVPVFFEDASRNGVDGHELLTAGKDLEHHPIRDFIYLTTYRTLGKFVDSVLNRQDDMAWPPLVVPWAYAYEARPDLRHKPEYLELEAKDVKLIQMLLDVLLDFDSRDAVRGGRMKIKGMPLSEVYDDFSRSMMALCNGQEISAPAVFTAQIALSIARKLGGDDQPPYYTSLYASADRVERLIDRHASESRDEGIVAWPGLTESMGRRCIELATKHVQSPLLVQLRQCHMKMHADAREKSGEEYGFPYKSSSQEDRSGGDETATLPNADNQDSLPVMPHEDDSLQNPLHCSSLALDMALSMEDFGISLANHHHAIFMIAHLYNALRHLDVSGISWPSMDRCIKIQKGPIFANDIPRTSEDIDRRLDHRVGKAFDRRKVMKLRHHEASDILKLMLEQQDIEVPLRRLQSILADLEAGGKASSWQTDRALSPLQLLSRLEKHLPAILNDIEFDYVTLTRHCCFILAELRTVMEGEQSKIKLDGEAAEFYNVWKIVKTLCKTEGSHKMGRPPWLQLAIDVFEKYLRGHVGKIHGQQDDGQASSENTGKS